MRKEFQVNKRDAVDMALDFMHNLAPQARLSLDEFLTEYGDRITTDEKDYGYFLLDAIWNDLENNKFKESLIELIEKYPNDADLGEAVRRMYNK
jgi:hypothetical protein